MPSRSKFNIDQSAAGKAARTIRHHNKDVLCDSKAEARYLGGLVLLERAGQIGKLELHPRFALTACRPGDPGVFAQIATYEADALFIEGGRRVAADCKGAETDVFRLKAKWFQVCHPGIELRVVKA